MPAPPPSKRPFPYPRPSHLAFIPNIPPILRPNPPHRFHTHHHHHPRHPATSNPPLLSPLVRLPASYPRFTTACPRRPRLPIVAASPPPPSPSDSFQPTDNVDHPNIPNVDAYQESTSTTPSPSVPSSSQSYSTPTPKSPPSPPSSPSPTAATNAQHPYWQQSPTKPSPSKPQPTATPSSPTSKTSSSTSSSAPPPPPQQPSKKTPVSRTLLGRIFVEFFSLLIGALLLCVVVLWRFSQLLALNFVRAFTWLAGVRRLGRWAFARLTRVDSITIPAASLATNFRRIISTAVLSRWRQTSVVDVQADVAPNSTDETRERRNVDVDVDAKIVNNDILDVPVNVPVSATATSSSTAPSVDISDGDVWRGSFSEAPADDTNEDGHFVDTATSTHRGRRLILLRHANTLWDRNADTLDHDRVLSARGKTEARVVGSELARLQWIPDIVLCSDAVRTVQTLSLLDMPEQPQRQHQKDHSRHRSGDAITTSTSMISQAMQKELQQSPRTMCTESLYYAVTGDEMAIAVDDALGEDGFYAEATVMIVCHNPGCEELVEQLTGSRPDVGTACAALLEYVDDKGRGIDKGDDQNSSHVDDDSFSMRGSQEGIWRLVRVVRPSEVGASP